MGPPGYVVTAHRHKQRCRHQRLCETARCSIPGKMAKRSIFVSEIPEPWDRLEGSVGQPMGKWDVRVRCRRKMLQGERIVQLSYHG